MWLDIRKARQLLQFFVLQVILLEHCGLVSAFLTKRVELGPGVTLTGLKKKGWDQFLGVPFAQPPTGNLRFRNPLPAPMWTGNRMAILPRLFCWTRDFQFPVPPSGSEDCLYLNIYRPNQFQPAKPLNVLVFVHGGGFYGGTNNPILYGADYWMETGDVILVTITHRLNIFGFLATGDEASPGNYGLKDVTMALRWIKDNIAAFGGDPEGVTLMGHSAGSAVVNYHLISNHSQGLYKNAYMTSGNIIGSFGEPLEDPRGFVNRHARLVDIENPELLSSADLVQRLREVPPFQLAKTLSGLFDWDILPSVNYRPSVEPEGSPDPFLTVPPKVSMERGNFAKVPIMNSCNPVGDGLNLVQPLVRLLNRHKEFNERIYELLPLVLTMDVDHPNMTYIVDRVRFQYFGPTGFLNNENLDGAVQMATDYYFGRAHYRTTELIAKAGQGPVFAHYFNYKGRKTFATLFTRSLRDYGVIHADDLILLFRIRALFPALQLSADDKVAKDYYKQQILNFIKNDNPGYDAYDSDTKMVALYKNNQTTVISRESVDINRYEFFDEIVELYEKNRVQRSRQ